MNKPVIYTIGHSTHPQAYFLELLNEYSISCLVDVRSIAASSYNPQYHKESLSDFLKANGITYLHFAEEFGARQSDPEVLTSSAFSFLENTPQVPRFAHLSKQETINEVAKLEKELGAMEKMKSFSTVVSTIGDNKSYTYHLLVLNSLEHTINVYTYDRDNFEKAMTDYAKFEEDASKGSKLEPVLVSAGPMENLRKAYPNLFLDITEFERTLMSLINS